nr:hypothetical protein [Tanacetum cinerariifolium]
PLTPTTTRLFNVVKAEASECIANFNEGNLYGVTGPSVASNWDMASNNKEVGLPESWLHPCYRLDTWKQVYSHHINPIRGKIMWPKSPIPSTILPLNHHPQVGRPPKNRKKYAGEDIQMEITRMPCKHAVASNWNMASNNMEVGLHESWVHPCYRLDTWKQVYTYNINPIRGKIMWQKSPVPTTILPPNRHPRVGRPPKNRKKSAGEDIQMVNNGKLSRKSKTVTCMLCKLKGHNKRSCTGPRNDAGNKRSSSNESKKRPRSKTNIGTSQAAKKLKNAPGVQTRSEASWTRVAGVVGGSDVGRVGV